MLLLLPQQQQQQQQQQPEEQPGEQPLPHLPHLNNLKTRILVSWPGLEDSLVKVLVTLAVI
jgi:hypothetical protein